MYMIFDSTGVHDDTGLRIRHGDNGSNDTTEQEAYKRFANNPVFS
jgi:hypothetical protein